MKTKKKEHCPNKAKFILPWGGKLLSYCEVHANGICVIAQAIGHTMQVKEINTKEYCEAPNDLDKYQQK